MSNSNCCFLTCIQVSQEAGQVVWYSHLFQNFPQFTVIHTVKGFGIVNKAEIDVFLELPCFFDDQQVLAICSLVPLPFLKPAWRSGSSQFTYCWSLAWKIHKQDSIFLKWSAYTLHNLCNYPCAWQYTLLGSSQSLSSLGQDSSSLPFAAKIISKRNIFM